MSRKNREIEVLDTSVKVSRIAEDDFISLTDIARHRDAERGDYIIQNWLRNRNTIEFLGIWEQLNNPEFNSIEFDGIRNQAGLNSFSLTPKRWVAQPERLLRLNRIAIQQMRVLVGDQGIKRLEDK